MYCCSHGRSAFVVRKAGDCAVHDAGLVELMKCPIWQSLLSVNVVARFLQPVVLMTMGQ